MEISLRPSFIMFLNRLFILFLLTAIPYFFFVTKLIFNFFLFLLFKWPKKIVTYLFETFFFFRSFLNSSLLERARILLFIEWNYFLFFFIAEETVKFFLPLALLLFKSFLPPLVFIFERNPCFFFLLPNLGWKVLFIILL